MAAPILTTPIPDFVANENQSYSLNLNSFFSGATSFTITGFPPNNGHPRGILFNGSPFLFRGDSLTFSGVTGKISGLPQDGFTIPVPGSPDPTPSFTVKVTAKNSDGSKTDTFKFDIAKDVRGNSNITGLPKFDNVINARDGNDTIRGNTGNDSLIGDTGNDSLLGSTGNDSLLGGKGNDILKGGADNDILTGDVGSDKLFGEAGNDSLAGNGDNDTLDGGEGNDFLQGLNNDDLLIGAGGNDSLNGDAGNDTLIGANPASSKPGNGEIDTLTGFTGNDIFVLGDSLKCCYYDDKDNADYAVIPVFSQTEDKIQLCGSPSDYTLVSAPFGIDATGIYYGSDLDLIGIVQGDGINGLDLTASYFDYV
ncbi:MAG: hypothetical protein DSM107014_15615 [Gomphosphaeria aponina SAG 52.96 = DSM 107014]|uniref:Calcium-binding protein n=1 Tax=Gomphosphaeria aponina SAG 52.96 = DSM 107014 TaxID=1521640 RepID=A0A941JVK9_9CHRO|nr:hypothetical protein [Gomphosphaeria aponina SAG 52.96 = DSM 107014]